MDAKVKATALESKISKKVGRAIADYKMIEAGDRILVAVSGGKDSLTLLKVLWDRKKFVPVRYDVIAVHVDLGYRCVNKEVLKDFLEERGYPFSVRKKDILKGKSRADITCFWCCWNRRKALFEAAKEHRCNKIALGHHKDDIVETILMNMFFEGQISAMTPHQKMFKGKLSLIRPLAYVEEAETEAFAALCGFPVPHCACPNAGQTKRAVVKALIAGLEKDAKGVKSNIFRSLQRIKKDYLL